MLFINSLKRDISNEISLFYLSSLLSSLLSWCRRKSDLQVELPSSVFVSSQTDSESE
jgi:hypothetical protein